LLVAVLSNSAAVQISSVEIARAAIAAAVI